MGEATQSAERREIESLRETTETLHIRDVDSGVRSETRQRLSEAVESVFELAGEHVTVSEIFVYGSFARGDALPGISDLDVRVTVHTDEMYLDQVVAVEEEVRTKLSPEVVEGAPFGFVDPKIVRAGSEAATGEVTL